ncbi:MAG: ABC transporter permease subunit [Solirubrobacteraceae bacterium]
MTPFPATLRSEWTKLVSLRSTKLTVALGAILGVGLSALLAVVAGATWHDWEPAARREFEPIGIALVGGVLSAIFFLVLGVKAATAEYGSGMIRLTLAATPRRSRVLAAKAAVVAAITLVAGLVSTAGMFLAAQAVFASYGLQSARLGDADALRTVLAGGALSPLFPVIALALGIVLRSTAAAVIAVFALIFAPPFLGGLLPAWVQEHLLVYLPGAASDAIAIGHLEGSSTGLAPGVAALVLIAWLAVFLGGAWAALERRDG